MEQNKNKIDGFCQLWNPWKTESAMHHRGEDDWNDEARQRSVRFLLWLVIVGLAGVVVALLAKRWLGF